ncbi:hypothetical protein GCM10007913_33810 [Devosia yakushimensis]|uniref:Uncharacterized protein n=1 Tax=Devosia yakushimensis TaxID=470028 RepID=A0ABQ5UH97_9HYPH|nr:hypothetical protein [Devosia yakushimensis]GLQ11449.1 hypothetical protein GCM10007913_33810 [Devosia yakushimensis]
MTDPATIAVQKFRALPVTELNGLFADDKKVALLALRQKDRPAYEDLFDFWRQNGWRNVHALKREVESFARQMSKPTGQLDPDIPMASAKRFREEVYPTLIRYENDWLVHRGSH